MLCEPWDSYTLHRQAGQSGYPRPRQSMKQRASLLTAQQRSSEKQRQRGTNRERESERELHIYIYVGTYIYMYVYRDI